jgi:hypothetical protein
MWKIIFFERKNTMLSVQSVRPFNAQSFRAAQPQQPPAPAQAPSPVVTNAPGSTTPNAVSINIYNPTATNS